MSWWGGVWAPLSVSMWLCWWRCCCLVAKSNPTLLGAHGCSLPVSSVHGISQARILEWRTSSSSRGPSHSGIEPACPVSLQWQVDSLPRADVGSPLRGLKVKWSSSVVSDSLWPRGLYVAYQAPQSIEFSRQEFWSGLPFSSPGDLPNPGIEPRSSAFQADALPSEPRGKPLPYVA